VQLLPVAPNPDRDIVVQEGLGETNDRVGERARIGRWVVGPGRYLGFDQLPDASDRSRLNRPAARGQEAQRAVALALDQRPQRLRPRQAAVYPVEHLEQSLRPPALHPRPVPCHQELELAGQDLAEQLVARAEPAVDGCSSQPELIGHQGEVDALPAQVLLARAPHDVRPRRPGRPTSPARHAPAVGAIRPLQSIGSAMPRHREEIY
jgi:hypothetical protein